MKSRAAERPLRSNIAKFLSAGLFVLTSSAAPRALAGQPSIRHIEIGDRSMTYEVYPASEHADVILLLHGHSGPANYRAQAEWFERRGFTVLLPHYTDVHAATQANQDEAFRRWIEALQALIKEVRSEVRSSNPQIRHVALLGYSQGASLALAAGSQNIPVDAIAEWYGSLPDTFFARRKGMPPLLILHGQLDNVIPVGNAQQLIRLCALDHLYCESHIYPGVGHGLVGLTSDTTAVTDADDRTVEFLKEQFAHAD
jgi:dienelactone hydrolase